MDIHHLDHSCLYLVRHILVVQDQVGILEAKKRVASQTSSKGTGCAKAGPRMERLRMQSAHVHRKTWLAISVNASDEI